MINMIYVDGTYYDETKPMVDVKTFIDNSKYYIVAMVAGVVVAYLIPEITKNDKYIKLGKLGGYGVAAIGGIGVANEAMKQFLGWGLW